MHTGTLKSIFFFKIFKILKTLIFIYLFIFKKFQGDYVRNRYPRQPTRFGRLLLAIPLLRMIRASTVETVFFRDTVGDTSVIRLLHDMYNVDRLSINASSN